MRFIRRIILISLSCFFVFSNAATFENKILFKINNEIITSMDLLDEIEYIKLLNKQLVKLENEKIFEIAKNSAIREKIKIIELSKFFETLEVEEKYLNLLLEEFKKKLNIKTDEQFNNVINTSNLSIKKIEEKIQIEILWNQLIIDKFSKDIKINRDQIKKNILENNLQKEYLLSEIVFNLDNENLESKFNFIQKEISNSGFENAASIYSISNTSNNGGKLGWIKINSLNKKIKKEILETQIKNYTNPIVIPGGFLILKVEDERETNIVNDVEKETEIISREIANKQLNQFANIYFNKIKKEVQINEL
jgi:peptidyl-prolyl cis-trans isomerase SurA